VDGLGAFLLWLLKMVLLLFVNKGFHDKLFCAAAMLPSTAMKQLL
jgi:hypothetical protein